MSINKLISIYDSVNNAFEDMGIDITNDAPVFLRWAIKAEKKIGSYYGLRRKVFVLDVKDCIAHIPNNARFVNVVVEGDRGCDCDDLASQCGFSNMDVFGVPGGENYTFLIVDVPDRNNRNAVFSQVRWEVQDNKIVFAHKMTCDKVTIQAMVYEVDCHGYPLVNENHIEALTYWIQTKYAERSRFTTSKMTMEDISLFNKRWESSMFEARADDSELSETDRADIADMRNDPLIGYGFETLW
jgi:hypothetical protein